MIVGCERLVGVFTYIESLERFVLVSLHTVLDSIVIILVKIYIIIIIVCAYVHMTIVYHAILPGPGPGPGLELELELELELGHLPSWISIMVCVCSSPDS